MTTLTVQMLTPEIVLVAVAVAIYLGGAFSAARWTWSWLAAAGIVVAALALWAQHGPAPAGGPLLLDGLAWRGRWFALAFGLLFVLLGFRPVPLNPAEYAGSLLLTVAGLMLVFDAGNLVLLFVALELISIPTYVLLYLGRGDAQGQESAAKYFFLSVLSSAILLYGFSFLYGVGGSTQLAALRAALADPAAPTAFRAFSKVAVALILGGLCFRITAVPFHFYAPDVYQGTNYTNAALLSVIPKAAGFAALVRLLLAAMPGMEFYAWRAAAVIAVLSMTTGNVLALWQDDMRRLLAYSSIAHAGYMLMGLAVALATGNASGSWNGLAALWFYLVVYAAATLGAFAILEHLGRPPRRLEGVEELAGLGRTRPLAAALMAVFLFSLTGVPLLGGFWGKFWVFGSALNVDGADAAGSMQRWFTALAIVGVLNAAVGAAYYLRVVAVMYFRTPLATPQTRGGRGPWWAALACGLIVLLVGFFPGPLMRETNQLSGQIQTAEVLLGPVLPVQQGRPTEARFLRKTDGSVVGSRREATKRPPPPPAPGPGVAAHPATVSARIP
jgi:NADH-quinone oxidoreductase subunit N